MARPKTRDETICAELSRRAPKRVLDIAYAHGPNNELAKLSAEVSGVDPLGRAAAYGETKRLDINTEPLPFGDNTFDAVAMGCVLSHLSRPLMLLGEINRVLKPGGTLILSSPNPHYYWEIVLNVFYSTFKKRVSKSKHIEHFFEFSRYAMRTILERCGFSLRAERGILFSLVKTGIRLDPEQAPALAYEIMYVAEKTGEPEPFTVIEEADGTIVRFPTDLLSR